MDAFDQIPSKYKRLSEMLAYTELPSEDLLDRFKYDIKSAKRVIPVGRGRSEDVGTIFAKILQSLGYDVHSSGDATFPPRFGPGDLVIPLSGSWKTKYTLLKAKDAKKDEAKVVAVTSNHEAASDEIVDYALVIKSKTKETRVEDYAERQLIGSNHAPLTYLGSEFELKALFKLLSVAGTLKVKGGTRDYHRRLTGKLLDYEPDPQQYRKLYQHFPHTFSEENPFVGKTVVIGDQFSGMVGIAFEKRYQHLAKEGQRRRSTFYSYGSRVDPHDFIFAISGEGAGITYTLSEIVKNQKGCKIGCFTSFPDSPLGKISDSKVIIPGRIIKERERSSIPSDPMESLFEARGFLSAECLIDAGATEEGITEKDMQSQHSIIT